MAKRATIDPEVLAQFPAAEARAAHSLRTKPHAEHARYDKRAKMVRIGLRNGVEVAIPADALPGLVGATDAERADIEVLPFGIGLNWERLDVQYSVPAIIREALGPWVLMQAAGSAGGSVRSKKKAAAARENGKKGGRPRKERIER